MLSNHGALVKPVKIDAHIHIALDGSDWRKAKARHANGPDERWIHGTLAAYAQAGRVLRANMAFAMHLPRFRCIPKDSTAAF